MRANNISIIKEANLCLVLNTVMEYEPITVESIVFKTRLSRPTIINFLKELINEGIVYISGLADSLGGRQAALYSVDVSAKFAIGIDFDYPPLRLNISNIKGIPVYSKVCELDTDLDAHQIADAIVDIIDESITQANIEKSKIIGIGLGIPGTVDVKNNNAVKIDRFPSWVNIPIDKIIQDRTGFNVYIRNNAHLLGLAEKNLLDKDTKEFLYFINSVGIGMAVFINGQLYEGNAGNTGYIGHTSIDINGELCECGQKGCVELYCSKKNIEKKYAQLKNIRKIPYKEILRKCDEGDKDAVDLFKTAGKYLGTAISNAIRLFDIPAIVIGGLECSEDHVFVKTIKSTIMEHTASFSIAEVNVRLGQLTEDNFGLGGCQFMIEKLFSRPKLIFKV
jgi:predicted NBD/HSP70 family sugar kinase